MIRFSKLLSGMCMLALTLALVTPTANADWFSRNERVRGSGDTQRETRDHTGFTSIATSTSIDIEITVGGEFSVIIEGDDNLLEYIEIDVRRKTFFIDTRDGYSLSPRRGLRVIITMPLLESIDITGSADMLISGVKSDELDITITGSGDITIEGEAGTIDIRITGSGDIDARHLQCDEAYIRISGSGDVGISVEDYLDVRVSGSGDVDYWGSPKISKKVSGSGDIRRRRG